jgi:CHAD domain-containing protein
VQTPEELIDLPAGQGAKVVLLSLLDEATAAAGRLAAPAPDDSALHDFRVAVRRLRSWLRALDGELAQAARGKVHKRLRTVQELTGASRDAEVGLLWLTEYGAQLSPAAAEAGQLLELELSTARQSEAPRARGLEVFDKVARALREAAQSHVLRLPTIGVASLRPLAWALVEAVREGLLALGTGGVAAGPEDAAPLHRARIRIKRLRYLVEPLKPWGEARALLKTLKARQELLGELHDRHALLLRVQGTAFGAGTGELAAVLREQVAQRYAQWEARDPTDAQLAQQVDAVVVRLARRRALAFELVPQED